MVHLPFANRLEAGRLLANELSLRRVPGDAVVLALARGGVPVGFAVADRLHLPLDIIVVRKIGVPWQRELAMGAIAGPVCILDEQLIRKLRIWDEDVNAIIAREQAEMKRREDLYRGGRSGLGLHGRSLILVDDGLATGSTMLAAAHHVQTLEPARVTIAVPIGSQQACDHLRKEVDDLVCLAIPKDFSALGEWYSEFSQVSDTEVQNLLAESRRRLGQNLPSPTAA